MLLVEKNDFNEKYYKKVARYALFQIIVNFILTIVKFIGGFISTSSALISDGVDSLGDVFVLPSKYEPFGAVVNEALLAGCYVLCSLAAGASCLIEDGVNGNVFSPDSLQELVSLLKRSLDNVKEDKHNRMLLSYDAIVNSLVGEIECLN